MRSPGSKLASWQRQPRDDGATAARATSAPPLLSMVTTAISAKYTPFPVYPGVETSLRPLETALPFLPPLFPCHHELGCLHAPRDPRAIHRSPFFSPVKSRVSLPLNQPPPPSPFTPRNSSPCSDCSLYAPVIMASTESYAIQFPASFSCPFVPSHLHQGFYFM